MYRDISQWRSIRRQILNQGIPKRQVARERGLSRKTISKILKHPHLPGYSPRPPRYPKLGPYIPTIDRLLNDAMSSSLASNMTVARIVERLRQDEGFTGSYDSVRNYIRRRSRDDDGMWECAYDL